MSDDFRITILEAKFDDPTALAGGLPDGQAAAPGRSGRTRIAQPDQPRVSVADVRCVAEQSEPRVARTVAAPMTSLISIR